MQGPYQNLDFSLCRHFCCTAMGMFSECMSGSHARMPAEAGGGRWIPLEMELVSCGCWELNPEPLVSALSF